MNRGARRATVQGVAKSRTQLSTAHMHPSTKYSVGGILRITELDIIDKVPEELWMELCDIVQEAVIKTISRKKKHKRQNGCLRRPY